MQKADPFRDYVDRILNSASIEEVWQALLAAMEEAGFDRLLYVSTRFLSKHQPSIDEDALVLTNHAQAAIDVFVAQEVYKQTPTGAWRKSAPASVSWRIIEERFQADDITEAERKMRKMFRDIDVVAGYTIVLVSSDERSRAVIGLCARPGLNQDDVDALWAETGGEIETMCNLAHLRIMSLPQTGQRRPLTTRQREVLRRVADGATTQDIAHQMGLTISAVEKHLKLARKALGVRSTAQAVQSATLRNLLL